MKKIKCNYCGKSYKPKDIRDCCPSCGAFNEIEEKEVENKKSIVINLHIGNIKPFKIPKILLKIILFFIVGNILLGILGSIFYYLDYEPYENYEFVYSNDLLDRKDIYLKVENAEGLDRNYNKNYHIEGRFPDLMKVVECLSSKQFSFLRTFVPILGDSKVNLENFYLYIDSIEICWGYNGNIDVSLEIESSGNANFKNIDIYLIDENSKYRLKENKYSLSYDNDELTVLEDLFKVPFVGTIRLEGASIDILEYDYLEIYIDDEIIQFELNFENAKSNLNYYGLILED